MTDEPELVNLPPGHRVTWFNPSRPVEGGTVHVHPPTWWTDSGWSTAHLLRGDASGALTVCGRVMRQPREAGSGLRRCHYCATAQNPEEGLSGSQTAAEPPPGPGDPRDGASEPSGAISGPARPIEGGAP